MWIAKITPYFLQRAQPLLVPASVVHFAGTFARRSAHIQVLLPDGELVRWTLMLSNKNRSTKCHIGIGWHAFWKAGDESEGFDVNGFQEKHAALVLNTAMVCLYMAEGERL